MNVKQTEVRRPHKETKEEVKTNPIKEETMATQKEFTTDNPLLNYAGQAQDAWKEIYGYQVKTSQALLDQMMKWGQTYTDHMYTQVSEATRLSQEALKSGAHLADEMRKNYVHMSEKMTK